MTQASVGSLLPFSQRNEKTSEPQEVTQILENPSGMRENTSNKSVSPQTNVKGQQMFFPPLACSEIHTFPRRRSSFALITVGIQNQAHINGETETNRCIRKVRLCPSSSCRKTPTLSEYTGIMEKYRPLNILFLQALVSLKCKTEPAKAKKGKS